MDDTVSVTKDDELDNILSILAGSKSSRDSSPSAQSPGISSPSKKGRFFTRIYEDSCRAGYQVREPNEFQISTMYRKRDRNSNLGSAVAVLVGRLEKPPYEEKAIEIVFDTDKISEEEASEWWETNKYRFE